MTTIAERLTKIESILPHAATADNIEEAEQLLQEISTSDLPVRFTLLLKIASFYLECKALNLSSSITSAKQYYYDANSIAVQENNSLWIIYAISGIANCVSSESRISG